MTRLRKTLLLLAAAVLALLAVLLVNTFSNTSKQVRVEPVDDPGVDAAAASERLAGALRFRTVSFQDHAEIRYDEILRLREYVEGTFPRVHTSLTREIVGNYSMLYTWEGRDRDLAPVLLAAHLDVVPVPAETEASWTHPPFDGVVADGHVWGRGAMDDKVSVFGALEAVESLLAEGFAPRRTVYLAFGHDEEIGGVNGAARIAALLAGRGVRLECVLDEGHVVAERVFPGVAAPVASIGVAEKGFLSLELIAHGEAGHSSMPPRQTSVGILAAALVRLEENPVPGGLRGVTRRSLEHIGPEMGFPGRLALSNLWLFGPLVERQLAATPAGNATLRTTTAPTMLEGSPKDNVLPQTARALVNFRVHPDDTVDGVIDHVRRTIADDRVAVEVKASVPPTAVSSAESAAFKTIGRAIRAVFPAAVVTPNLVLGQTDARHYEAIANDAYRFLPLVIGPEDVARIHGVDERVSVEGYGRCVRFYRQLVRELDVGVAR
jgi:carboxypeptidase PM20D1